jgi:hypothetical protein
MTYDDWKLRSDRDDIPQPERWGYCTECEHYEDCGCPCCTDPDAVPARAKEQGR